jgi:hypothetical protein
MDEASSMKALFNILVVIPCICALALHFLAESAGIGNISGSVILTTDGDSSHDPFEHSEDDFTPTKPITTTPANFLSFAVLAGILFCNLPVFLPHFPPPKIQTTA